VARFSIGYLDYDRAAQNSQIPAAHQIECELARMNGDPPPAPYRSYRWGYYFLAGALALVALRPFFERLLS